MADAEYKRLGCKADGCDKDHKALGLCQMHYRRFWRTGTTDNLFSCCTHCGKGFESKKRNSMYCSNACKVAAWVAKNGRIKYEKLISAFWTGYCTDCSVAIGGRHKKSRCGGCQAEAERAAALARAESKHKDAGLVVACDGCAVLFCPLYGASNTKLCLCCKSERKLQAKANSRLARKMRKRVQTVESVNPIKVFERDGWRCQLCKRKTLKALRGTLDPRAPELDHIMPVSLGGEHSYRNTQCSCRSCNAKKSNRPMGQMLLLG